MFKSKVRFSDLEALELIGLLALCSSSPSENTGRLIHHLSAPATAVAIYPMPKANRSEGGPNVFL